MKAKFPASHVIDRRAIPSHGYRAMHLIPDVGGKPVEIQVRTEAQHYWAQLCEKLADRIDTAIKYGGGSEEIRNLLEKTSQMVAALDKYEAILARAQQRLIQVKPNAEAGEKTPTSDEFEADVANVQASIEGARETLKEIVVKTLSEYNHRSDGAT